MEQSKNKEMFRKSGQKDQPKQRQREGNHKIQLRERQQTD